MARSSSTVSLRNYRLRSLVKIEPKLRGLGIKYILGLYNRVLQLYGGLYIIHIWHSINFKTWNFMFSPLLSSIISKFKTQFPERQMKILKVKKKKLAILKNLKQEIHWSLTIAFIYLNVILKAFWVQRFFCAFCI